MPNLTNEQISQMSIRQINAHFRREEAKEMNTWPVCGEFNPADRAIRRLQRQRRAGLVINGGLEYYLALDHEISEVVNSLV